jgi:hypothetical protein
LVETKSGRIRWARSSLGLPASISSLETYFTFEKS